MFTPKLDYHIAIPDSQRNAWIDALRASELRVLSEETLKPPHPGPYPDFNPRGVTFSNGETSTWLTIAWSPYHRNYAVSGVIRRRPPEARAALAAVAALQSIGGEIDGDRLAQLRDIAAKDAPQRRDDS